jgi:hypothetical protein
MARGSVRLGKFFPAGSVYEDESFGDYGGAITMFYLGAGGRYHNIVGELLFGFGGGHATGEAQAPIEAAGFDPSSNFAFYVGMEGQYQLWRGSKEQFIPWVGGALGYMSYGPSGSSGNAFMSIKHSGWELRPEAGIDYPLTGWFALGLAAELGIGRFSSHNVSVSVDDDVTTLENESFRDDQDLDLGGGTHTWFGLSLRAVFLP